MPYKNKEDRNEAMKCYRERKKEEQEQVDKGERLQSNIAEALSNLGFVSMPYRCLVECIQEDDVLVKDGVMNKKTGKLVDNIEVFFGLNMPILFETPILQQIDMSYLGQRDN